MVSKPICRFHQSPGGCRQGAKCKFAHTTNASAQGAATASGSGGNGNAPPVADAPPAPAGTCRYFWTQGACPRTACTFTHQTPTSPAPPAPHVYVPNGVCRAYWTTGQCGRGAGCKFQHQANPSAPPPESSKPKTLLSHFEDAGLGRFPALESDKFTNGISSNTSPGQAFGYLKKFLADEFRFQTAAQVYTFLDIVCSASTQNSLWKPEDGYEHLNNLAKGNGILRIGDAIRFPREPSANDGRAPWSFQRGYVPLLTYLSSEWVTKSTVHHNVNKLYGLIHTNFDAFSATIIESMTRLIQARTFQEPGRQPLSGMHIFKSLFTTLFEYLTRFKDATTTNPAVCDLVQQATGWFDEWTRALGPPSTFQDEITSYDEDIRAFLIKNLTRTKDQVASIIVRTRTRIVDPTKRIVQKGPMSSEALIANLQRSCEHDGPGENRDKGPRHDNDHVLIEHIRIAPTHQELMCEVEPYLPPNFPGAPHFYDAASPERLLDIQFRLLREELIAPIRLAAQLITADIQQPEGTPTILSKIINAGGGRYAAPANLQESVIFSVFTNLSFQPLSLNNRGTSVGIEFEAPPGKARNKQATVRVTYWEQVSKKRLMQGGLVALVWKDISGALDIYIGTVASSPRDLVESCRKSESRVSLRVSFFDTAAEIRIVRALQTRGIHGIQILIEAPVFFEGIRPFLEALKKDPALLPFSQYLCHQSEEDMKAMAIAAPSYSLTPRFAFELKDLFPPEAGVETLALKSDDEMSITHAKEELSRASRLDPSQADAVVDSLTREVCLIQGPPGTGKSYTGLEIIRVLIKNKVSPILLVAFTNHALDHMLKGVLDADITKNIIRLGSRHAADERVMEFSLENAEKLQAKGVSDRLTKFAYREMKTSEEEMRALMNKLSLRDVPHDHLEKHVLLDYPLHYEELFTSPPEWIWSLALQSAESENDWTTVGESKRDFSILDFWRASRDLAFLRPPKKASKKADRAKKQGSQNSNPFSILAEQSKHSNERNAEENLDERHQDFISQYLYQFGLDEIPTISETNRPVEELLQDFNIWGMSSSEREALYNTWYMGASQAIRESQVEDFENLRRKHADALKKFQEVQDQNRVDILKKAHIVGCTTTGAAKVVSLLSGMAPKVMVVEEAGQVLESHILASLVPSVEQMIMIGDPLQLRPNINNYKLSIDNRTTGPIYRFDQSLMERLHRSGFPMSQLDVQRRMRPAVSSLIRNTLYPKLEDHPLVLNYPDVRGMHKNVYFVTHTHKEVGGGEDAVSKYNQYELDMIYDLVLHLLKQGCYNSSRNIVVLSAYLGQIPKIRQKLQNVVTTVVDERDAELLERLGLEDDDATPVQQVQASSRVVIRTLDNFQGEEGEVIILSLVRNSGSKFDGRESSLQHVPGTRSHIGFLKSDNRVNVGLSRAKHGLYIFGNAPELARGSRMWATVLKELHASESLGTALPISCHQHPDYVEWIDQPGRLPLVSPDGGCLQPCNAPLSCGHRCPHKCHANDPNHISTKCYERCLKLCSRLSHPCDRKCCECTEGCGDCMFPVSNITLPCGHIHPQAPCHIAQFPEKIKCLRPVVKELPSCEHTAKMPCHRDPSAYECKEQCGAPYSCCSRSCKASCGTCKKLNSGPEDVGRVPRTIHPPHPCGRRLFCGHDCRDNCEEGHACSGVCNDTCRQICPHRACRESCSVPCQPCVAKCAWKCTHMQCPATCGMACTRLPCDKKCEKTLQCGHPCPSVCGEPCDKQTCRICAGEDILDAVVDLIMQLTLRDLDDGDELDSLTITLRCGHTFTVETLDGITHLGDFYERDSNGKWVAAITPETHGESRTRPVCPTCRGDIDALRYGRVCKGSNLAILQHNISSKLSKLLIEAQNTLDTALTGFNEAIAGMQAIIECPPYEAPGPEKVQVSKDKLDTLLRKEADLPTPPKALEALDELHALPPSHAKVWKGVIKKLLRPYRQARQITTHRDSTVQTYQASLATLYKEELDFFLSQEIHAPQNVEQTALRLARMRIGQPPPRASFRFTIEAFWVTIRILITLAETASTIRRRIHARDNTSANCHPWSAIAEFFLQRAIVDAYTSLKLAEDTESWNKAAKCQAIVMQAEYELAAHLCRTAVHMGQGPLTPPRQAELRKMCAEGLQNTQETRTRMVQDYVGRGDNDRESRLAWINTNFLEPTSRLADSWGELERFVISGSGITREESRSIMQAFSYGGDPLSYSGHFYECRNGHPYVIGDCGQAWTRGTCPECGTSIGGEGHRLTAGNQRASRFIALAS